MVYTKTYKNHDYACNDDFFTPYNWLISMAIFEYVLFAFNVIHGVIGAKNVCGRYYYDRTHPIDYIMFLIYAMLFIFYIICIF